MSRLNVSVLGPPEVRYGDREIAFPTRKALALLIYLIAERGMQPREKLMALLWPDSDAAHGRGALRMTLYYLRRALDAAVPQGSDTYLLIASHALGFNFAAPHELDLDTLLAAVPTENTLARQAAADLYRGPFLEGFSLPDSVVFDDWVTVRRSQIQQQLTLLFDHLTQLQSETRQFKAGIANAVRWLACDPFNETAYCRLMQLQALNGTPTAGLETYRTCQRILEAELGVEPAAETQALAARLRAGRATRKTGGEGPERQAAPTIPFVGRFAEHAELAALYQRMQAGETSSALIEGEAGIGKTHLVAEFLGWLTLQGVDVWRGRAFEVGGRLPYQPVVEALRERLEREGAPGDLLSEVWLAELSRLLPELRDSYPELPAPPSASVGDEAVARTRLLEAVARLGSALARHGPQVLFIDDVHWADTASLDTLLYCSRVWARNQVPILLLVTVRTEALAADPVLREWLSHLEREIILTRLTLGPISAEETAQLVQIWLGDSRAKEREGTTVRPASAAFAEWLYRETSGHPFFICETLKWLRDQGLISSSEGGTDSRTWIAWSPRSLIPPRVRQQILGRLRRLSPTARLLLTAAAVLGRPCSLERLCQVAGVREEDEASSSLEELLNRQLLLETANVARPYAFSHDKIRDVVYTEAGAARRRLFHRRAFRALETASASPAELAHHALAARLTPPAFQYSVAAGDEAMRVFALRDAIAHHERARQLIAKGPDFGAPIEAGQRRHLYRQLGRAYELDNQFEKAQSVYQELLAFAEAAGHLEMVCEALNRLATVDILNRMNLDQATAYLQQAQRIARDSGNKAGLAETEWNLAQVNFYKVRGREALAHAERALALARELGLQELTARSLNMKAYALSLLGQWRTVEQCAREGQTLFATMGNRPLEGDCLNLVAIAQLNTGRPRAGVQSGRMALDMSRDIENVWGQGNSAMQLVPCLLDIGEYGEALAMAQRSVALARVHVRHMLPLCLTRLGSAYRALLNLDEARATLREAAATNEEIIPPPFPATIAAELCVVHALSGSWAEAYSCARQVLLTKQRSLFYTGLACWYEVEALLRAGDEGRARECLDDIGQRTRDNPRLQLAHLRALAVQAEWKAQSEQAVAYLEEANSLAEGIGLPGEQWLILAKLGELYGAGKNTAEMRRVLARAAEIVRALADRIEDEDLRQGFLAAEPVRRLLVERTG
ncbi:MAG: AAA family ATPase [Ardenticatenaceae bacterium]|nr:AAA family ATPase [Ardenticatenaceae bacterium]